MPFFGGGGVGVVLWEGCFFFWPITFCVQYALKKLYPMSFKKTIKISLTKVYMKPILKNTKHFWLLWFFVFYLERLFRFQAAEGLFET